MTNKNSKRIIILYHKDCLDGFGAAWAAYKKFGKKAEYIGAEHNAKPPKKLKDKNVYFLDFSYNEPEIMKKLFRENKNITVIDHHESAESLVKLAPHYCFDLKHSGAVLAWNYFHPKKPTPRLLRYIEDGDLWKFRLSRSKEIIADLGLYDFNFAIWDKIGKDFENSKTRKKYIEEGKIILKYKKKLVDNIANRAYRVIFEKHKALAVNSSSSILHSEIGHELVKRGYPIGIVWYRLKNRIKVSLRSDGKTDVAKIAEKYGGGGHKAAAGFSFPHRNHFPWKQI